MAEVNPNNDDMRPEYLQRFDHHKDLLMEHATKLRERILDGRIDSKKDLLVHKSVLVNELSTLYIKITY